MRLGTIFSLSWYQCDKEEINFPDILIVSLCVCVRACCVCACVCVCLCVCACVCDLTLETDQVVTFSILSNNDFNF